MQHGFDQRIESLRADLRKNEEAFKSDLRAKETEIAALRDGVLSGRTQRQALLDRRRMEAVERVWLAIIVLAPLKSVSASMAVIKFESAAEKAPHDANVRKFFEIILGPVPDDKVPDDPAKCERPFVSPLVWAYLSAYRTIVVGAFVRAKMLAIGMEKAGDLLDDQNVSGLLKAALPHRADFIDQFGYSGYHQLLDEVEDKLLAELKKMLEGADVDQKSIKRSAEIMESIRDLNKKRAEDAAKVAE